MTKQISTDAPEFTMAQVNAAIEQLAKAQARTHDQIGKILVMGVYASIAGLDVGTKERDYVGPANALVKALRTSMKKDAIVAFLMHFGALNYNAKEGFKHFTLGAAGKLAWTKDYVATVQNAARDWEAFRVQSDPKDYDVEAAVMTIVKAVAAKQKKNQAVKHAPLTKELVSALARYHAAVEQGLAA